MTYSSLIAPHLQAFFADYLCHQKRLSPQTIVSCRDTFRLLLTFLRDHTSVEPSALRLADVDASAVLRFLDYLEQQRGNSIRSRNIRLSAIRSFFRLVALRDPDSIGIATRVLAIPLKREDKKLIGYLTRPEMQALLTAPEQSKWSGRRDHALLLMLLDSGVFFCLMLLDIESASRQKDSRSLLRPPDKPFPKESVHVHSGGDVSHQRENAIEPGRAHGSNATAKTLT